MSEQKVDTLTPMLLEDPYVVEHVLWTDVLACSQIKTSRTMTARVRKYKSEVSDAEPR